MTDKYKNYKTGDTIKIFFCIDAYTMKIIGVYLYDIFDFLILFNKISNIEYIRAITGEPKIYILKFRYHQVVLN